LVLALGILTWRVRGYHLPGNQQGYAPVQPIAFSHRQHAGDLQINCLYCHTGADKSLHAGIASATTCMNCHRFVTTSSDVLFAEMQEASQAGRPPRRIISPELQKLYDALGLDEQLQPDPHKHQQPIEWVQVHNLPAFTRFNHQAHTAAGVQCATCHGPVETMERISQVHDLSMGWCVNCHRERSVTVHKASTLTDCATCHY
jgi:hypothetical protein